jgi:ABC-type glycerol-3-phosphate transport system substrate-binding protein
MRRIQRIVALAALLALLLAACTTPTPTPQTETVTITFACKDYQRDQYRDLAQEFHKVHPAISVEFVSVDEVLGRSPSGGVVVVSTDDVYKIAAAADTFVDSSRVLDWATPQDIVLGLIDLAEQDDKFTLDDFYSGPLALFQSGGKLWGLPFEADALLMFYNPELFHAVGVPYPQIGWSWDDFLEAASRLTIREGDTVKQYGYMDPWPFHSLPSFAHQKAGPLVDYDREPPLARLDVPGVAETVQWYADLALLHGVMPNLATMDSMTQQRFPYEQFPALWVDFARRKNHFPNAGVIPFPEAGEAATTVSAYGYFVSAGTAHPEAAWKWVEFLSRQPPDRYERGIPARKSVAEETGYWKKLGDETAAVYRHALEHAVNYPSVINWALSSAFEMVLQGEPVDVALTEVQAKVSDRLAEAAAEAQRSPKEFVVATPVPTPTPGGTLIRFLAPYGVDMTAYRDLASRFQQTHPDIAVEVSPAGGGSLAEQAAAADCFAWYVLLPEDSDVLLALDPLIANDETFGLDTFAPAFLEPLRTDGVLQGLPLETDAWLLYYNRDLFDAAGSPHPATNWTPQQFIEQAIALTDVSVLEPIYGFYPRDGAYTNAPDYVAWLGGQLFDADGRPTFDDPTVVEALTRYADLITRATPPSATERGESHWPYPTWRGGHPGPVGLGRVAMWIDFYDNHRGAPPLDFEVGAAPLPAGAVPLAAFLPQALFISAQTPHPDACWDWISFLSAQPEAVSWLPVRRDLAASEAWREQAGTEAAHAWLTILDRGKTNQRLWALSTAYYALYWFDEAFADVLAGARPAAALAEAQGKAAAFADCMASSEATQEGYRACIHEFDLDFLLPDE